MSRYFQRSARLAALRHRLMLRQHFLPIASHDIAVEQDSRASTDTIFIIQVKNTVSQPARKPTVPGKKTVRVPPEIEERVEILGESLAAGSASHSALSPREPPTTKMVFLSEAPPSPKLGSSGVTSMEDERI